MPTMTKPLHIDDDASQNNCRRVSLNLKPEFASEVDSVEKPSGQILQEILSLHRKVDALQAGQAAIAERLRTGFEGDDLCRSASSRSLASVTGEQELCAHMSSRSDLNDSPLQALQVRDYNVSGAIGYRARNNGEGHMRIVSATTVQSFGLQNSGVSQNSCWRKLASTFPVKPDCRPVMAFDLAAIALLFYDSLMIPFVLAWDQKSEGFFFVSGCFTALFWTLDVMLRFVTSIASGEVIIADFFGIAKHYLKTWFVVDITVVAFDWLGIAVELAQAGSNAPGNQEDPSSSTMYLKLVRLLKVSRMVRIFAMVKAGKIANVQEFFTQKAQALGIAVLVQFMGGVMKLVFVILWLNHIGACAFIGLGRNAPSDTSRKWEHYVSSYHVPTVFSYQDAGLSQIYQYLFAYYFSLTTMFSGNSPLLPMSCLELLFTIVGILFGVLFASSMISSMSAMLMDCHEANRSQTEMMIMLRKFLHQHQVDPMLSLRIQNQVTERITVHRRLVEADIAAISYISADLRAELRFSVCEPLLNAHRLWRACDHVDDRMIKNLCKFAVNVTTCNPGEVVFDMGTEWEESLTVAWGSLHYTKQCALEDIHTGDQFDSNAGTAPRTLVRRSLTLGGGESETPVTSGHALGNFCKTGTADRIENFKVTRTRSLLAGLNSVPLINRNRSRQSVSFGHTSSSSRRSHSTKAVDVRAGQEICGIALWVEWTTMGLLETVSPCELLHCSAKGLEKVLLKSSHMCSSIVSSYALAFVDLIDKEDIKDLSDLAIPAIDHDAIVAFMPQESRILMSLPELRALKRMWFANLQKLEEEIKAGKCNLGCLETDTSVVVRVVRLAVLRLKRADGFICCQVGEIKPGHQAKVKLLLPAKKLCMQETVACCVEKLLDGTFKFCRSGISLQATVLESQVKVEDSAKIGLRSRYIRYFVEAEMDPDVNLYTQTFDWNHLRIECFCSDLADGVRSVFVWLSQQAFEELSSPSKAEDQMLSEWVMAFQDLAADTSVCSPTDRPSQTMPADDGPQISAETEKEAKDIDQDMWLFASDVMEEPHAEIAVSSDFIKHEFL